MQTLAEKRNPCTTLPQFHVLWNQPIKTNSGSKRGKPCSHEWSSQQMPCPASSYTILANVWVWVFSDQVGGNEKYSHLLHLGDKPRCVLSHTCVSHTREKILTILTNILKLSQMDRDLQIQTSGFFPHLLCNKDARAITSIYTRDEIRCRIQQWSLNTKWTSDKKNDMLSV